MEPVAQRRGGVTVRWSGGWSQGHRGEDRARYKERKRRMDATVLGDPSPRKPAGIPGSCINPGASLVHSQMNA